ncbi:leucine--tRNA ligase [Flavobacterium branchiophilum]|uniref:Leucine--tRNA ligase n=1 Tax=Flavobacterium branchiophilum TaxID=55197 RepID=A0A2H3KHY8_9FLAO|nr:class I tRNA ligase family protein [Flavobacterium branchiophilum]PDS23869.1 leucine--tRNA ligase [Flavobacterium branchiophilum]
MKYNPNEIEAKWQKYWAEHQTFAAQQPASNNQQPKYYVLDMFPYPSGAGLHVGHPLGYIASDIVVRYKRHQGYNVLHPQGYDSFGLPAEQYAIQTGQHPEKTTRENIARYREQLDKIGFSFDWSREVRTSNPDYYKHTQWIFIQLFESWYNKNTDKAEDITTLIGIFEKEGNANVNAVCDDNITPFSAEEWNAFSSEEQQKILLHYRLTYLAETEVNWCPALGTVLANDEIVNGVSERGGHPVIRKKMTQWSMRISAYAERLLQGLDTIDWSDSIKESQRNWIGKSVGAMVRFKVLPGGSSKGGGDETFDVLSADHKEEYRSGTNDVLPPTPSKGGGDETGIKSDPKYLTGDASIAKNLLLHAKEMRKEPTFSEAILWDNLRRGKLDVRFRRQHLIGKYIVDFVCLEKKLIVEVDGEYHNSNEQMELDNERTLQLEQKHNFKVIRFTNEEVNKKISVVLEKINHELNLRKSYPNPEIFSSLNEDFTISSPSPSGRVGEGKTISVFTTRPDTIFGVTFMTLAPEHELVAQITTPEQKQAVEDYIEKTAKRSERERMADVKTISGVFTGAYAEHPFTQEPIPVWIGDYVLAGYGTGAVMAVPCGDERDYAFANFFKGQNGMPAIKNIISPLTPEGGIDASDDCIKEEAFGKKEGFVLKNSDFLDGLGYKEATKKVIEALEDIGAGKAKVNYRLRDAVFSRQRYWGEPFPVYYVNGLPQMIDKKHLPIVLPEVEKYLPTEDGQPPLGNATNWAWDIEKLMVVSCELIDNQKVFPLELNTMPGWAGSSWYWMRYMDAHNETEFASEDALKYWENVDLYIGGSEHATGHLLYSRFWNKFLKDKGFAPTEEPFKKLINQGMILGMSAKVYKIRTYIGCLKKSTFDQNLNNHIFGNYGIGLISSNRFQESFVNVANNQFILKEKKENLKELVIEYIENQTIKNNTLLENINKEDFNAYFEVNESHVPIDFISDHSKNTINIKAYLNHIKNDSFIEITSIHGENQNIFYSEINNIKDDFEFVVHREVEKMSKSKYNVVNPDDICNEYGADTLRLYEMFLGPLEQAKPWNTAGISGVYGFLKKLWKLYHSGENDSFYVDNSTPSEGLGEAYKTLHKTIKKVTEDIENFSFNTSVSQFMICVNELSQQKCHHRAILEPLALLISPYAPHIAEELWSVLGHEGSISKVAFPKFEAKYLVESEKEYPVSFNGKMRFTLKLPLDLTKEQIEEIVMADERTQRQLDGKTPNKVIIVPGKIINLVG